MKRLALALVALLNLAPDVQAPEPAVDFSPYWEVIQFGRDLDYPEQSLEADFYTVIEHFPAYDDAHRAMLLLARKHPEWTVILTHVYGPETGEWDFLEYWCLCPREGDHAPLLRRQIWFDPSERCYDSDGGCTPLHRMPHPFRGPKP